ncbi:HGxxPAAW family protein [Kocuria sp. KH4]
MANENQIVLDHTGFVGHGNTLAAWVTIGIMSVGVIVGVTGFTVGNTPVLIVGIGLVVVGLIAGAVLRSMGHGAGSEQRKHEARNHHG